MADELYGRAIVRVDAETKAAAREIRDFSRRADANLRNAEDAIGDVTTAITALRTAASTVRIRAELDDQIATGAATVHATLADLAAQGPLRIPAHIDDDTAAGAAAIRTTINELRSLGPVTIPVDVDGGTQAVAAAQALRDLRQDAGDASQASGVLAATSAITASALGDVRTAAQLLSQELRGLRTRATAAARALDTLRENALQAAMALRVLNTVSSMTTRHLNDLGDSAGRLRTQMTGLRATVRTAGNALRGVGDPANAAAQASDNAGKASEHLKDTLKILATAALPVAASMAPIAASVGAAAIGMAAFGVAVIPQISALSEAAEAEKKYQDAIKEHGRGSEQAAKAEQTYLLSIKGMPPATRQAAASLSVLKEEFGDWSDSLAKFTMVPVTKGLDLARSLLPKLTPLVRGTSDEFSHFMDVLAGATQSGGFGQFANSFAEFTESTLARATSGLVRFTQAADSGEVGGNIREFMAFARENGPIVADTFQNVVSAAVHLAVGFSDVGVSALTVINALSGLVNAIPASWVSVLIQAYAALKLVRLGMAGVTAVASAGAVGQLSQFARAARFGGVGSAISGVAQRMSTMSKVAGGLGVLGAVALGIDALADKARGAPPDVDKLTTSLKSLATTGRFTGELENTFGSMDGFVKKLNTLRATDKMINDQGVMKWADKLGVKPGIDAVIPKIDDLVNGSKSMGAAEDDFKSFDKALSQLATGGHAKTAASEFKGFESALRKAGYSTKEINALFPQYKASVAGIKAEQRLAAQGMGLFGDQAQATGKKLELQKASADGLRQSLIALNTVSRSAFDTETKFQEAIDNVSKSIKDNGNSLDVNTAKGRANRSAFSQLGAATEEAAAAARDNGASWKTVNGIYAEGRKSIIDNAVAMGKSRKEAAALADKILKIPNKTTRFKGNIEDLKQKVDQAAKDVKTVPASKRTEMRGKLDDLQKKLQTAKAQLKTVPASKRSELRGKIDDLERKVATAKRTLASVKDKNAAVRGKSLVGQAVANARRSLASVRDKTATVHGRDRASGVVRGILGLISRVRDRTATITTRYRRVEENASPKFRAKGGPVPRFAGGGMPGGELRGPGTGTSDSIPMWWGSNGEYIVNARSTAKYLPLIEDINADRLGAGAGAPQMAAGGAAGGAAAGRDVARGLAGGMSGEQGLVESQAAALAATAVLAIRRELQISSPSKKTRKLGRDTGAGFIKGLTGTKAKIDSTAKAMAKSITAAFKGTGSRTDNRLVSMIGRDNKKLQKLAGQRDAIAKKIADARKFSTDIASKAKSSASLGSIVSEDFYAPAYVEKRMKASLSAIKSFSSNVSKLQKKGLSKSLLRQILEMGPEQGAAFAKSLAGADKATIKRYNKTQAEIDKASKGLGNKGADMLYDSGKKAGKGLLAGLKAQQKDIEKLMLRIAKGMQKAIRRALRIKSPSQVMAEVGRLTMAGLGGGILREVPMIERAMGHVATAVASVSPRAVATPAVSIPSISRMRTSQQMARAEAQVLHLHVHNSGVIGSQMELDNWLTGSLDRLQKQRRLPAGVGSR